MAANFRENHKKRFVNPYNFIPLMETCGRSIPDNEFKDCYTGYFDCRIKLLTPLFIPNTSSSLRLLSETEKNGEKCIIEKWKGYDFYSYDDWSSEHHRGSDLPPAPQNPVIPGSEIRGALRCVYEAAFNGCMSSVSVDPALSRRTNKQKKSGILKKENNEWVISPCERAMLFIGKNRNTNKNTKIDKKMGIPVGRDKYNQWKEGQEIWVKFGKEKFTKNIGKKTIEIAKVVNQYREIKDSSLTHYNEEEGMRKKLEKEGYVQSWLHKGEKFPKKHHESVFYVCKKSEEKIIKVNHSSDIDNLKKILDQYSDPGKNRNIKKGEGWYSNYEISEEGTLVYYCEVEDHVYLSPACLGREAFTKTIGDLLQENGGYDPCTDEKLCPACQIFGMVGKSRKGKTYAYGSKVRVTDAVPVYSESNNVEFEDPVILPELGEPKPETVEFYTEPPYQPSEKWKSGEGFWTYDYKYKDQNNKNFKNKQILSNKEPKLRGRKYYWHSDVDLKQYKENELSTMRQRIRPMKAGGRDDEPSFCFRIYFERLNRTQLNQLKWAIDFGNPDCAHKIGRAKPLGFGSVRLNIDNMYLREIDGETGIWKMKREADMETFFSQPVAESEALKIVQKMANWEEKPLNVRYPSVESNSNENSSKKNDTASHQWFAHNKQKHNFFKVLPKAEEDARKDLEKEKALYTFTLN